MIKLRTSQICRYRLKLEEMVRAVALDGIDSNQVKVDH